MIVMEQTYEVTDPTIDSQIVNLKNSGANVFFNVTIPKFAVQAHQEGARHRLEAGALPEQRVEPRWPPCSSRPASTPPWV